MTGCRGSIRRPAGFIIASLSLAGITSGQLCENWVSAGDTRRYQCWYRDNSGAQPCGVGVNDFNLSNGYEIAWLP